jgi:hypothetical protein
MLKTGTTAGKVAENLLVCLPYFSINLQPFLKVIETGIFL